MIVVGNVVLSDDIADQFFVCDLEKCKGACCVEGDLGAPLEEEEMPVMHEIYAMVKPYMSEAGIAEVERQGVYIKDEEGDFSTPTIGGRECAYAIYDDRGILKCAIEQAYLDGKISFRKPISCHLYPIRISKHDHVEAVNYSRWGICNPACKKGKALGVPLYEFLKVPLVRKYGEAWYAELVQEIKKMGLDKIRHKTGKK
jgi:hypothetical protein